LEFTRPPRGLTHANRLQLPAGKRATARLAVRQVRTRHRITVIRAALTGAGGAVRAATGRSACASTRSRRYGTAVELGVSHIDTADAYRPYLTNEIIYKTAKRADDAVLAATADQYIAYVPHFPLGGFPPLQSEMLELVAKRLDATPMAVAQSWPTAALAEHNADPLHLVGCPPARKHRRRSSNPAV